MGSVRHWFAGSLLLGAWAVFGVSCASNSQAAREPLTPTEAAKPVDEAPTTAASGCADSSGEAKQCATTAECCKGFVCGLDPGKSHVTRYCLEG